jgi:hypothetical protein
VPDYPTVLQAGHRTAVKEMPNVFLYTEPRILARSLGGLRDPGVHRDPAVRRGDVT